MSCASDGRDKQVQLDSTRRRRINVDACFNAPQVAETPPDLGVAPAKINGFDVLIVEVFEDIEKEKNPG